MADLTGLHARAEFLAALSDGLSVSRSAARAGISRMTAYNWRKAELEFAEEWDAALDAGTDKLEDEAYRRAHDGVPEPLVGMGRIILDKDGNPVTVLKYSDGLLTTLLKARRPDKFKDRVASESKVEIALEGGGLPALVRLVKGGLEQS